MSILVNYQFSSAFTTAVEVLYVYETALVIIMHVYALNYNGAGSLAKRLLATELDKHVFIQFSLRISAFLECKVLYFDSN